ncbi:isoprenylcysteine carboxyl methyltransferase [Seiridium cupressi]
MSESPESTSPPSPPPKVATNAPPREEPPAGFHYLVSDEIPSTPTWKSSFGPSESVEEDKAWTSGAAPIQRKEDAKRPLWANNKRKDRRISLQLPTIRHEPAEKDADDLLPIASPMSARPSPDKLYFSGKAKSLEGIALRSFCLGITLALSVVAVTTILVFSSSPLWRVPFFFAALSTFHFLEFWTTAKYNTQEAKIESFLLTANWPMYFIAHSSATLECFFTKLIWPNRSWAPLYTGHVLLLIGFLLVVVGQFVRATAMMQLGTNFNHIVQDRKRTGHELVTSGIYGVMRHPSYFGFFYWGVGTQIVLGNPICFAAYLVVLWRFFSTRIRAEETHMSRFFGDDFTEYQKRVPTMIPFIR